MRPAQVNREETVSLCPSERHPFDVLVVEFDRFSLDTVVQLLHPLGVTHYAA